MLEKLWLFMPLYNKKIAELLPVSLLCRLEWRPRSLTWSETAELNGVYHLTKFGTHIFKEPEIKPVTTR